MFIKTNYTDQHIHPGVPCPLELVAYERRDGGWDVFAFEPVGSVPELECNRSDECHIFLRRIDSPREIDVVAKEVTQQLGSPYEVIAFFRESYSRRLVGRLFDHLKVRGCQHLWVCRNGNDWELRGRRKDLIVVRELLDQYRSNAQRQ